MKITAESYDELKRFALCLYDQLNTDRAARLEAQSHPRLAIEAFEGRSMAIARKGVAMMIGDLIEQTQDLNAEAVAPLDARLVAQGLPTLTQIRARFWGKIAGIMKRERVRSEAEYYAHRNVVEGMPEADQPKAWSLLGHFETRRVG